MKSVPVCSWSGEFLKSFAGEISVSESVFGVAPRSDILARMVRYQLAKKRSGCHKVKGRSEVSGTTRKPFKQKGTGRARAGSRRAAQFVGGGIIFGPVVRDHSHSLQKKVRKLALKMALSDKMLSGKLHVVNDFKLDVLKAKELRGKLDSVKIKSVLFVGSNDEIFSSESMSFSNVAANLVGVDVLSGDGINVYSILSSESLIISKSVVSRLNDRLS
jgi:large subunit ribosomal protein L4